MQGPFYHGTKANLAIGDLQPQGSSLISRTVVFLSIYFSALMEPAVWGAELAMSLSGLEGRYIYIVGHCCKVSDEAAFVLFKGLTFQNSAYGAFRPGSP
ncbi:NAD(+)--rifampin ADP-ribosyltransferase [Escherichia coli]|uniref:NAD(+)--rifampin ADP-ribosyltransferase n=1 Tax=Escherichia coli TaxID=562 RepID=UPI0032E902D8